MSAAKLHYLVVSRVSHLHHNFHTYNSSGIEDVHVVGEEKFYPYRGQIQAFLRMACGAGNEQRLHHFYFSYKITD